MSWLSHAASMSTPPRPRQHYAASPRISCSQPPVPCSQSFAVRRLAAAFCSGRSLDRCLFSMCHPDLFGLMTSLTDRYQHILYPVVHFFHVALTLCRPNPVARPPSGVRLSLALTCTFPVLRREPVALSFDDWLHEDALTSPSANTNACLAITWGRSFNFQLLTFNSRLPPLTSPLLSRLSL
jgi:hypothetical protein